MAKYVRIKKDTKNPNGKTWLAGSVHMVGNDLAKKLIEDKEAEDSTGPESEFVEAIKKVTRKRK
jgi:hypothetical protein